MYVSDKIELRKAKTGRGVFAIDDIVKDEILIEFEKRFTGKQTRTSMQIDEGVHQEGTDPEAYENFLNHSCEPNGYVDFEKLAYRSMRDVKKGEELTFNYMTTEYEEIRFTCNCGSKNCYKDVRGFKYLSLDEKRRLEKYLSPFLKKKLAEELKR